MSCLVVSTSSFATTQLPAGTGVTGMSAYSAGVYVHLASPMLNLKGCSATHYELWIDFSSSHGKGVYATALAAFLSGRLLGLRQWMQLVGDCSDIPR